MKDERKHRPESAVNQTWGNVMNFLAPYRPQLLSVMRIVVALVFLQHPASKFLDLPHTFFNHLSPAAWPFGVAGSIETVFGLLLLFGLWSRLAAFILSGEMAVAYFWFHVPNGFFPMSGMPNSPGLNNGEAAVIYCFVFLFLAAAGAGPWSIDATMGREKAATA
ncbi:MAG TPA: DoxX family protein [Stellaceae bacterium]|jgi:putative oxidoreductase|nr:DoxX family protein [Stellaceae bacterium]